MAGKKWTAYDVPYLRDDLISSLEFAERNIGQAKRMFLAAGMDDEAATVDYHYRSVKQQYGSLVMDDVELHYFSKSMCALVRDMADDLPEWTAAQAMPSPRGFLVFEQPMCEQQYVTDKISVKTPLRALFWHTGSNGNVEIVTLTGKDNDQVIDDADGDLIFKTALVNFDEHELQGAAHKAEDVISNDSIFEIKEFDRNLQYNLLLSIIGATWLLMSQQSVSEQEDVHVSVKERSSASTSAGKPSSGGARRTDVIVQQRSLARRSASGQYVRQQESANNSQKTQRNYTHQWWVRGHWRQQACGPKRAERRPVYIEPHVAGPSEKPEKPNVTRWRS